MSRQPQRLLVIGSTGQVGLELLRTLAPLGEVVGTARSSSAPSAGDFRQLDVTDLAAVRQTVRDVRPTVIVNAAAYTAVDRAESEPELAMAVNAHVPGVLAEEARRLSAALVHYSTDYVFDGSGSRPWREADSTCPLGVYGSTKLAGEEAVRAAGAAHVILRISWIYAPHGHNFVKTMLKLGADRPELRVVADQIGAPTPASRVAGATAQILSEVTASTTELFQQHGGTFHVPTAGATSWHGFAEEIFRLGRTAGLPLLVERVVPIVTTDYPTPARRPRNSRLDGRLAAERFGIRLPDWREALASEFPAICAAQRPS